MVSIISSACPVRILNLPPVLKKLSMEERGMVLVTGTTGSGKSTTLAAMVNYINDNRTCNIITVEDPVEYLHKDRKSIISQREIGFDTLSFANALKSALRQDPDVILVRQMRDLKPSRPPSPPQRRATWSFHAAYPGCRRDHQQDHLGFLPTTSAR
jgi:twitching motility protein PilT